MNLRGSEDLNIKPESIESEVTVNGIPLTNEYQDTYRQFLEILQTYMQRTNTDMQPTNTDMRNEIITIIPNESKITIIPNESKITIEEYSDQKGGRRRKTSKKFSKKKTSKKKTSKKKNSKKSSKRKQV